MLHLYNAQFREIYHKIVFIEVSEEDLETLRNEIEMMDGANGVIAYGFLEERAPMTFVVLASAKCVETGEDEYEITIGPPVHEEYCRFRYGDVEECRFLTQDRLDVDPEEYAEFKARIDRLFEPQDPDRRAFLELDLVDRSRNIEFPEYVSVTLYKEGFAPELTWARCAWMEEGVGFHGYLAHDPKQKFGIGTQDEIVFRPYDNGQGGIMLMWDANLHKGFKS